MFDQVEFVCSSFVALVVRAGFFEFRVESSFQIVQPLQSALAELSNELNVEVSHDAKMAKNDTEEISTLHDVSLKVNLVFYWF